MFTLATGCAVTCKDLVSDNIVKIKKVSSQTAVITYVSVIQEGNEVTIHGEVRRWSIGWGLSPGHNDIDVFESMRSKFHLVAAR